jgi:HK97 family phage major capsid protein
MQDWIKLARAGRVTADACTQMDLPPSTNSLIMPKLKTGTATAAQSDLGTVSSHDPETETITVPVITIAGNQDLARQLFDRMLPGFDTVLFGDLAADYATRLDINVLSGNGSAPNSRGILETAGIEKVTFTSASPTVAELYGWLADAAQRISSKRYLAASAIIMHPRRWGWLLAQVDTTGRPLVVPHASGAYNATGNMENVAAQGIVGELQGLPVLLDPSIPTNLGAGTNQDSIIVARVEDSYLWENQAQPVNFRVFEEVLSKELAIRLQVFGYSAFTGARYPQSIATVGGTGLVTPVFV